MWGRDAATILAGDAALVAAVVQARLPLFVEVVDALIEDLLHDLIVGEFVLEGGDERADCLAAVGGDDVVDDALALGVRQKRLVGVEREGRVEGAQGDQRAGIDGILDERAEADVRVS